MKKINAVWITGIILLTSVFANAQNNINSTSTIKPQSLEVSFAKTVNLIFPYAIKSVDKGSKDLLVQVAKGVENILQVKAAVQGFAETNLTVITSDAKLYSYLVNYTEKPADLAIKVDPTPGYPSADARFSVSNDNDANIQDFSQQVALKKPVLKRIRDDNFDVKMALQGIYINDHKLFFQLTLSNNSNIVYDIDQLRFYIRDQKKSKRTASQEVELQPEQITGNAQIIRGQSEQTIVVTLSKFTIPDKKYLAIQLMEKSGGRNLELHIKNKLLIKAKGL